MPENQAFGPSENPVRTLLVPFALLLLALFLSACGSQRYSSAREWERAECNRVIDQEARERCMRRIE
jgi:hypothetical protein